MKRSTKQVVAILLLAAMVLALLPLAAYAAGPITTDPTGYTQASDVNYKTAGKYVLNWGARDEDCVFLSKYAESFYTGNYTFDELSQKNGGSTQSDAHTSELYMALQSMMKSKHRHETNYQETRDLYRYTDCLKNDSRHISSFYSGIELNGKWDSGKTWNREHTWPNSKGMNGNDENDIMMLRPTSVKENSSRGNTAYGQGRGYYDPGESVRGDCARIVLYVYVRWGNTRMMWGKSGVMENLDVLLKWMEEDPVDTWEMGRNDAVQSITGTRNVFVDYPEYAWMLFGREVPQNMATPSGEANGNSTPCAHAHKEVRNTTEATCTEDGYTGDTYCCDCGKKLSTGKVIPATGHTDANNDQICDSCGEKLECSHAETEIKNAVEATCGKDGYTGDTCCKHCGAVVSKGEVIPATKEHTFGEWVVTKVPTTTENGIKERVCSGCGHKEVVVLPMLDKPEPTEPEQSKPDTTEPEQSKPDATEPEQSKPDTTEPEQSKPDATEPEQSKPDTTEPEQSKPDTTEPEQTKPDATKPSETKPEGSNLANNATVIITVVIVIAVVAIGAGVAAVIIFKKKN